MKLLLILVLASLTYAAESPKPFVFGRTNDVCTFTDGKLDPKHSDWESCAYGILQYASTLEQRLAECKLPKPEINSPAVAPKKK